MTKLKSELFTGKHGPKHLASVVKISDHRLEIFEDDGRFNTWIRIHVDDEKPWADKRLFGTGPSLYDQLWSLRDKVETASEVIAILKGYDSPEHLRLHALAKGLRNFQAHECGMGSVPSYIGPPTYERIDAA